ncbi:MAG: hypothetical protein M3Q79_02555 [bacterium]|nr:hypothetical protein [bacterium]
MTAKNIRQIIVFYILAALALTLIWNIALRTYFIPNYFVETKATVFEIISESPISSRGGRQTNLLPTYEYIDDLGNTRIHKSSDGFNAYNSFLFKKHVGDSKAAYYEKGSNEGLFVTDTGD